MSEVITARQKREFLSRIKEARIGDPAAQYDVALMYANGIGVSKNLSHALTWTQAAAEKGHPSAQYLLGRAYQEGKGTAKDAQKALSWYLRASEKGNDKAALQLAKMFSESQQSIAFHYALAATQNGLTEAQVTVGDCFAEGCGTQKDASQAAMWYELAAQQGGAIAQHKLGQVFEQCAQIEQSQYWYRLAAAQGVPAAQLALHRMDGLGKGRRPDSINANGKWGLHDRRSTDSRWGQYASKGSAEDCFNLGIMYETGIGVEKSAKQARIWFQKAADRKHHGAMAALGRMLMATEPSQAAQWLVQAAEFGQPEAQFAIAQALQHGRGIDQALLDAFHWYAHAARQDHAASQFALAELLSNPPSPLVFELELAAAQGGVADAQFAMGRRFANGNGVRHDEYQACQWYQLAAEQGHVEAQNALATCYEDGVGIQKSLQKAFLWYEKAANQGHSPSQWHLGEFYASGLPGLLPDAKKALLMCKRAASAGFVPAQATLGNMFAKVKKHQRAAHWWSLAAEQGDPEAQFNLANAYRTGKGVEKNEAKAFDLMMTVAMSGLAVAQSRVGLAYATGEGAVLDHIEAAKWFILAAAQGDKTAAANQKNAQLLLSPAQWAEATRRANVWRPSEKK